MSAPAAPAGNPAAAALRARAEERFRTVAATSDRFFRQEVDAVAGACRDLADRFRRGGRLLAVGRGSAASDAWHVAVEFTHPVLVGKRALPALALVEAPERELALLARPDDALLILHHGSHGGRVPAARCLTLARKRGLLSIALQGGLEVPTWPADHRLVVPHDDPTVVQEVQETLYHVLWELTHVFLDHRPAPEGHGKQETCGSGGRNRTYEGEP